MVPDANGLAAPVVEGGCRSLLYVVVSDIEVATVNKKNVVRNWLQRLRCRGIAEAVPAKTSMNAMVAANVVSMMMRFIALPPFLALSTRVLVIIAACPGGLYSTQMN
jgi:hypothetical protein